MTLVGQPEPSPALRHGFDLLAQGKVAEAEAVVKKAALDAKARHGSGSAPLARAYGELARLHLRTGDAERAAREFQHAAGGPMPDDRQQRVERLSYLYGFGVALGRLGRFAEAEKVLRRCQVFAQNLYGGTSAEATVALVPLADLLLTAGQTDEGVRLAQQAYDTLWDLGHTLFAVTVGTRAEAVKARGRPGNPFDELTDVPEAIVAEAVAWTAARTGTGEVARTRAVLADLLAFVEKRYGSGHELTCEALAAVAHHEEAAGDRGDGKVRRRAVQMSLWAFATARLPAGLLADLEVAFEPDGTLHLAPHLSREPGPAEVTQIESVLNQAVNDLYSRPTLRT